MEVKMLDNLLGVILYWVIVIPPIVFVNLISI